MTTNYKKHWHGDLGDVLHLDRPLICMDCETTGLDVSKDRVVSVALARYEPGMSGVAASKYFLVNPGRPIPREATSINMITDQDVADSPTFGGVADELRTFCEKSDVAGYNVRFDLQILESEFHRTGKSFPFNQCSIIDALQLWKALQPRSLSDALEHWCGETPKDGAAHHATEDVRMASRVIQAQVENLREKYPERSTITPDDLHKMTFGQMLDIAGKFRFVDGVPCYGFGQHRFKRVRDCPKHYLHWMVNKDFPASTKLVAKSLLRSEFGELEPGQETPPELPMLDAADVRF